MSMCPDCLGTGKIINKDDDLIDCPYCEGSGSVSSYEEDSSALRC